MRNIYVIITTSLINDFFEKRKLEYINGINRIIQVFSNIPNLKFIIVENTNITKSFLDDFNLDVLYTCSNLIPTKNKGIKEILDIFEVIKHFNMNDDDFVVKVTGRYLIDNNSKFVEAIKSINNTKYKAILKYGGYNLPNIYMTKFYSCITGLIGASVDVIKTIEVPNDETTCIEWKWAEAINKLDNEYIYIIDKLGIIQYIDNGSGIYS